MSVAIATRLCHAAAIAVLLAAPAAAHADTTLRVMYQGEAHEQKAIKDVADKFQAANPGIKIELIYTPHDAYNEKVGAAAMSKALPDVMELDAPFLANYVWSGFLRPVSGYIDPAILADMTESNVFQGTYPIDKKLYAVSLIDSSVVIYADRKRLEAIHARIPTSVDDAWTGAEFEDVLAKLATQPGVKWPIDTFRGYGTKTEWITYAYSPILQSYGCDLIDRKTWRAAGTLDSAACVAATTELASWVKKGWVVPGSAGTNQFYAEGRPAALAWGGHWFYAEAHAAMGDDVVVLPLPKFGTRGVSPNGTWTWAITTAAASPEAAGKFLSFMINDKDYRAVTRDHTGFPGLKSFAAESPVYAKGGAMAVAFEQANKTAVPRPPHPAYPTITLAFMTAIDAVFNGADAKTELTKAAARIDSDIDDNDGYPPFKAK